MLKTALLAAGAIVSVDAFAPAARSLRTDVRRQVFQQDPDQKPLTAANEPEEFFASDFESMAPEEKLKDPLVLLGLGSIFLPFIMILGFQATGVI
jgi:hypothetical protein